ncbi:FtsQ-type POTRA domain-containing protein [Virgibacillus sp. C22-A2]|uniref:Cell division protein DivIB n=1 Tax=Virgibacillus tibetensis TaxID=3042313 RepID=A0ABU6KBS6_9BACI|nr:FtsQ-type POTRA domain-containing protein [Virgibacillus sp. C22-A2]
MSKKKVVSIEDRIPKLKQARKKKANRRLIFYLSIFFFLISIIVYLQSPLSHIKTINVTGNSFYTEEEVINKSELTTTTNIWTINKAAIIAAIESNPIINSVEIERKLPWTIEIHLSENDLVGYISDENKFYPVLGNGTVLSNVGQNTFNGEAPLISDFSDEAYLHRMTDELQKLPGNILNLISEIYWTPSEDNKNKIVLYMNDGYMVKGTIRNFADRMEVYPSIVSQLEPNSSGIIHIGVGAYFESFDSETSDPGIDREIEEEDSDELH